MACVIIVGKLEVARFCKRKCTYIHSTEFIKIYQAMCLFGLYLRVKAKLTRACARARAHTHTHTHMYMLFL